jgi:hypothetical protein
MLRASSGLEAVPAEAPLQFGQELRIDVGEGNCEPPNLVQVNEVEDLAGAAPNEEQARSGRERMIAKHLAHERGVDLRLADGGHVLVVIIPADDLEPCPARLWIHRAHRQSTSIDLIASRQPRVPQIVRTKALSARRAPCPHRSHDTVQPSRPRDVNSRRTLHMG